MQSIIRRRPPATKLASLTCNYCNKSGKSDEPTTNLPTNKNQDEKALEKPKYDPKSVTADDMRWRTPWHQKEGKRYSLLRAFYREENNINLLQWLHAPIDLSPSGIKKWYAQQKEERDIALQSYIPERHNTLGCELAAAHFIVYRGGAVKFHGEDKWIKADQLGQYALPSQYRDDKILEAIDCSDMNLYYEGLTNLQDLENVEWLSFNGCDYIDDWCLDKISNIFSHSLIYLDLRDCRQITERGIGALYKMPHLKILYLDDFLKDTKYEMTCLLLQEVNPHLDIRGVEYD